MTDTSEAQIIDQGATLVVKCSDEFDSVAVSDIRSELTKAVGAADKDLVFDFSKTEFIDSSGIGLCVFCFKKLSGKGRDVGIAGLKGQPKSVIELSQIDKTVPLFASVDEFLSRKG
tara:strand:+ start:771 stop:1118 length:348 start_codon:yes stop_codon:yes gene_type:complete